MTERVTSPAIIVDTDIGTDADDALALAMAAATTGSPRLLAVSVCGRRPELRAAIARRLLAAAGRPEVPVLVGASHPIDPRGRFYWFGNEGKGIEPAPLETGGTTPAPSIEDRAHAVVRALATAIEEEPGVTIVTIGTLTNLAHLVTERPDLVPTIGEVIVMGGHFASFRVGGAEVPFGFDYNLCADPQATITVLSSGLPLTLVPIDVSFTLPFTADDLDALAATPGPLPTLLSALVEAWWPIQTMLLTEILPGTPAEVTGIVDFLHDPLAVVAAIAPELCRFEQRWVQTAMIDGVLRTVTSEDDIGTRCRVVTGVDAAELRRRLLGCVAEPLHGSVSA